MGSTPTPSAIDFMGDLVVCVPGKCSVWNEIEVLFHAKRPEVLNCLAPINSVCDKFDRESKVQY